MTDVLITSPQKRRYNEPCLQCTKREIRQSMIIIGEPEKGND
jgi:hypothetical protein